MSSAAEAKEHEKQATKALTPSWLSLKFQPDILLASMEYGQAATKYRAASMLADSVRCHVKSSEMKEKQHDLFGAGRGYEQAATICDGKPELGDPEPNWVQAIRCYRLSGKGEIAAKLILKIAAFQEKKGNLAKAKEAYDEALDIFESDDKDYQVADVYKQFIAFLVRSEMFDDAVVAIDGHIKVLCKQGYFPFAHKEMLSKVVLALHQGDTVRAELALNDGDVKDWFTSNESASGFALVEAFQAYDGEAAERILKEQIFTFLQVEIARLARKLRVPTVNVPAPARAPVLAAAPPSAGYDAGDAPAPVAAEPEPEEVSNAALLM